MDNDKAAIQEQLAIYKKLAEAIVSQKTDKELQITLKEFAGLFFNNLPLVLDRFYV